MPVRDAYPATLLSMSSPFEGLGVKTADKTIMSHSRARACSYEVTRPSVKVVPGRGSAGRREVSPEGRQLGDEPDPRPGDSAAREVAIDLAGDVALQDPDDVPLGASLLHPSLEVGGGLGVVGDAHHGDAPQRAVGLAVPAVVPARWPAFFPESAGTGDDAAQVGPGGLGVEPLGVVAGGHQERRQRCRARPRRGPSGRERWRAASDSICSSSSASSASRTLDPVGQRGQRRLGGRGHRIGRPIGPQPGCLGRRGL